VSADFCSQSTRTDVCLFLFTQRALLLAPKVRGVTTPWTEYIRFLPRDVPVPSTWSAQERRLLQGTSLEVSLTCPIFLALYPYQVIGHMCMHDGWMQAVAIFPGTHTEHGISLDAI
jgi:hypothetical protein